MARLPRQWILVLSSDQDATLNVKPWHISLTNLSRFRSLDFNDELIFLCELMSHMLSTLLKGIELYRALKIYTSTNGYHAGTHDENEIEFLCITSNDFGRKRILEKIMCPSSGLYAATT